MCHFNYFCFMDVLKISQQMYCHLTSESNPPVIFSSELIWQVPQK